MRHRRTRVRGLCRCESCKPPTVVHGTQRMSAACHCDFCRRAAATYARLRAYTKGTS